MSTPKTKRERFYVLMATKSDGVNAEGAMATREIGTTYDLNKARRFEYANDAREAIEGCHKDWAVTRVEITRTPLPRRDL